MGLGKLVGVSRKAGIWDLMLPRVRSDLARIRRISWDQIVEVRNAATHKDTGVAEEDANLLFIWGTQFVRDCELDGKIEVAPQVVPVRCPSCTLDIDREWHYCPRCGLGVNVRCFRCSRPIEPGWRICPYCETRVGAIDVDAHHRAREEYRLLCKGTWMDGVVNKIERRNLEIMRLELGLGVDEAEEIETMVAPQEVYQFVAVLEGLYLDTDEINAQARIFLHRKRSELGIDPEVAETIERSFREDASAAR